MNDAALIAWMMVFLRAVGVLILLPGPGGRALPVVMRVAVAFTIATLIFQIVPVQVWTEGPTWIDILLASVGEVATGLAMGFVGRFVFQTVETAGRIIASEIGLAAAPGFDAPDPSREPVAAFISAFGGLLFFVLQGHFGVIAAFGRSFELAAAGAGGFGPAAPEVMARETAFLIELAVRIAAPFIALNFLINLSFSILTKVVPKMNVFILSFPVRIMGGMLLLAGSGMLIARYVGISVERIPFRLLEIVAGA